MSQDRPFRMGQFVAWALAFAFAGAFAVSQFVMLPEERRRAHAEPENGAAKALIAELKKTTLDLSQAEAERDRIGHANATSMANLQAVTKELDGLKRMIRETREVLRDIIKLDDPAAAALKRYADVELARKREDEHHINELIQRDGLINQLNQRVADLEKKLDEANLELEKTKKRS